MHRFQMILCILILFAFIALFIKQDQDLFTNTNTTRLILYIDDTASLDSRDPLYRYPARAKLAAAFSIKSRSTIKMCTSPSCIDTFDVSPSAVKTNTIVNNVLDNTFSFLPEDTDMPPVTEYFDKSAFATIPFRVTVAASVPTNEKLNHQDLVDIINAGTVNVWFKETDPTVRTAFQLFDAAGQFVPWSLDHTVPDIVIPPGGNTFTMQPKLQ